jgi:hypothetical protein
MVIVPIEMYPIRRHRPKVLGRRCYTDPTIGTVGAGIPARGHAAHRSGRSATIGWPDRGDSAIRSREAIAVNLSPEGLSTKASDDVIPPPKSPNSGGL